MTSEFDRELNANIVQLINPVPDTSEFRLQYDPGNPRADTAGYVRLPNVNALVEMMDMRDAQRSYEANIQALDGARAMLVRTIDLLRR
jgi:flagellar basal-body rod protein FlgC